jgi:hypothetical protein
LLAGIDPGSAQHRGCRRERYYGANDGAERDQPKICFHIIYLKLSKTDISQTHEISCAMLW